MHLSYGFSNDSYHSVCAVHLCLVIIKDINNSKLNQKYEWYCNLFLTTDYIHNKVSFVLFLLT